MAGANRWRGDSKWFREIELDNSGEYGGVIDVQSGNRPESFQPLEKLMLENDLGEAEIVLEFDVHGYDDPGSMYGPAPYPPESDVEFILVRSYLYGVPHYGGSTGSRPITVEVPKSIGDAIYDEFMDEIESGDYYGGDVEDPGDYDDYFESKQVKNIAKMISEDVNEHFDIREGWEDDFNPEWTPEDDEYDESDTEDPNDPNIGYEIRNDIFGKSRDPEFYLLRTDKNEWIVTEFDGEHVYDNIANHRFESFKLQELLNKDLVIKGKELVNTIISVVVEPVEWDVIWVEGWELTEEDLLEMDIFVFPDWQ